jgi:hypothetical protein
VLLVVLDTRAGFTKRYARCARRQAPAPLKIYSDLRAPDRFVDDSLLEGVRFEPLVPPIWRCFCACDFRRDIPVLKRDRRFAPYSLCWSQRQSAKSVISTYECSQFRTEFAADSPLEPEGLEPPVPRKTRHLRTAFFTSPDRMLKVLRKAETRRGHGMLLIFDVTDPSRVHTMTKAAGQRGDQQTEMSHASVI